jgi:dTMP kinase
MKVKNNREEKTKKGFLIAVEGIDGAGKRTLCLLIKKFLESHDFKVIQFAYPDYSSCWGKIIENYLHDKIELNINEQFFAYFIDILKDQDKIRELLKEGKIVLTDRYFSSTIAFQCAKGFSYQKALSIIDVMGVIEPDLTLFIQIPPELALKRKFKQKRSLDRHEKDTKLLENVDVMYEKMLENNVLSKRWAKTDGNQKLENVEENVLTVINSILTE